MDVGGQREHKEKHGAAEGAEGQHKHLHTAATGTWHDACLAREQAISGVYTRAACARCC